MKKRILFVCLGNICRSPAAEGIFKTMVAKEGLDELYVIDSAGTYGGHAGDLPDARMRKAAATRGYTLDSRSRKFMSTDFDNFDMVIVMDDSNYENVSRMAPSREALNKLYRMCEFCSSKQFDHIPDPYYEGAEGFQIVLNLLEDGCRNLLAFTQKQSL